MVSAGGVWASGPVWACGSAGVYGFLFGLGKLVLGEPVAAVPLFALAVGGAVVVTRELRNT